MKSLKTIFIILSFSIISNLAFGTPYDLNQVYKQLGIAINQSYIADMTISNVEGSTSGVVFRFFYKNGNIRIEGNQNNVKLITIVKMEGDMYTFNSKINKWDKIKIQDLMASKSSPIFTKVGTEKVDGKECTKFETYEKTTQYQSLLWIYDGLIYKKVSFGPNNSSEIVIYKNVEKKALDDSLFFPEVSPRTEKMQKNVK